MNINYYVKRILSVAVAFTLLSCDSDNSVGEYGFSERFSFSLSTANQEQYLDIADFINDKNLDFESSRYPLVYAEGFSPFRECVQSAHRRLGAEECQVLWDKDSDWDGIENHLDFDDDNDGIDDNEDQFPEDTDNDGIKNSTDSDIDNDGLLNENDGNIFVFLDGYQPNVLFNTSLDAGLNSKKRVARSITKTFSLYRDVDNDGDFEKVVIDSGSFQTQITIYPNRDSEIGGYTIYTYEDIWTESKNFALNDVNDDGYADFIYSDSSAGKLFANLYSSTANYGNVSPEIVLLQKKEGSLFHLGYVDDDRYIDVVVTRPGLAFDTGTLFLGTSKGTFNKSARAIENNCVYDDELALAFASTFFSKVYLGTDPAPGKTVFFDSSYKGYDQFSQLGDFNGDDLLDVRVKGTPLVLIQKSPCNFEVDTLDNLNVSDRYQCLHNADLDGDGDGDYFSLDSWPLGFTFEQNISKDDSSFYSKSEYIDLSNYPYSGEASPVCIDRDRDGSLDVPSSLYSPRTLLRFDQSNNYRIYFTIENDGGQETVVNMIANQYSELFKLDSTSNYIEYVGSKDQDSYLNFQVSIEDPYFRVSKTIIAHIVPQ